MLEIATERRPESCPVLLKAAIADQALASDPIPDAKLVCVARGPRELCGAEKPAQVGQSALHSVRCCARVGAGDACGGSCDISEGGATSGRIPEQLS